VALKEENVHIKNGVATLLSPYSGQRATSPNFPTSSAKDMSATTGQQSVNSYDFTNMTPRQMHSAMNDLIRRGEMSLDDSSGLVSMIPTALSSIEGNGRDPSSYDAPMDYIATLQTAIASAFSRGETSNAANLTKTLQTLRSLQGQAFSVDVIA
jgi:hypothetical protein